MGIGQLKSLYDWFSISRDDVIKGHEKEVVLLADNSVMGYYPDKETALIDAKSKGLKLGEFLVQRCVTEEEESMYVYTPEVSVNSNLVSNSA